MGVRPRFRDCLAGCRDDRFALRCRLQDMNVGIAGVEQGAAARAGHHAGVLQCAQFHRSAAVAAVESTGVGRFSAHHPS